MTERIVGDLSRLPTSGFGAKSPIWWGTLAFVALEGTGFALAIGTYLFLAFLNPEWPLGAPPPALLPGTAVTVLLLLSVIPNHLTNRWAHEMNVPRVRLGLVMMSLFGLAPLVVRIFEFPALNISWDENAYGSILWFLLGLHTTHLLTDVGDTLVLTALMFTKHGHRERRMSDVGDNAFYWDFVVVSWVLIYLLIYWVPRL
jgi:heme/copper-type cytochrome/quinol oxidase subunit 3